MVRGIRGSAACTCLLNPTTTLLNPLKLLRVVWSDNYKVLGYLFLVLETTAKYDIVHSSRYSIRAYTGRNTPPQFRPQSQERLRFAAEVFVRHRDSYYACWMSLESPTSSVEGGACPAAGRVCDNPPATPRIRAATSYGCDI
jgi:hypothetical protein